MNVRMLRLDGLDVAMLGAQFCVSDEAPVQPSPKALLGAVRSGHLSVLEHAVASFAIEGVSRVTETQLVRHRMASYSIQSGRYCTRDPTAHSVPFPTTVEESHAIERLDDALGELDEVLKAGGRSAEDRRYLYPQGLKTNVVMTVNLRELSHMCGLRRCARAQREIREMFDIMARKVDAVLEYKGLRELVPLFEPQCVSLRYCPEAKGCGKAPSLSELRSACAEKVKE